MLRKCHFFLTMSAGALSWGTRPWNGATAHVCCDIQSMPVMSDDALRHGVRPAAAPLSPRYHCVEYRTSKKPESKKRHATPLEASRCISFAALADELHHVLFLPAILHHVSKVKLCIDTLVPGFDLRLCFVQRPHDPCASQVACIDTDARVRRRLSPASSARRPQLSALPTSPRQRCSFHRTARA